MKESFYEFFWMWVVSVSPILLGSVFIKMWDNELPFFSILYNSIGGDIVVGYVATMVAPFLYMISKWMRSDTLKKKLEKIKFAGTCLALSVFACILTVLVFSVEKGKIQLSMANETLAGAQNIIIDSENVDVLESNFWMGLWQHCCNMSLGSILLLVCYVIALVIWFYTIYLNNLEPLNLGDAERERVEEMFSDMDSVVGGENS